MNMPQFKGRVSMKIDTTENWRAVANTFIPLKGEIIVYSDYSTKEINGKIVDVPNFKVGDGLAYGIDLPFVNDELQETLSAHLADSSSHVSSEDRDFWDNKVRCYTLPVEDDSSVEGDVLIFSIN